MSNSPRFLSASRRHHRYRRDSSAPDKVRRGAPPSFPSPSEEGGERRSGATSWSGTFERCRVPCDRHARLPALHLWRFFTRPPHFLAWTGGSHLTLSGRHWRRRSSRPVQPSKAAPSSGADGDLASWDVGYVPTPAGATPCSIN